MIVVDKKSFLSTYKLKKFGHKALKKYDKILPLESSSKLSGIVADLITDGHLQIRKFGPEYNVYEYFGLFSKSIKQLKGFNDRLFSVFGIKGKIRPWGVNKWGYSKGCIVSNAFLTRILSLCGVPHGDKMIKIFVLPEWIMKSNFNIKSSFLRRSFTCDGSISFNKNCKRWEIRYHMNKADSISDSCVNYLNQLRQLLRKFDVISTNVFTSRIDRRNKDGILIRGLEFKIYKPKSILNFADNIGFDIKSKKDRLKEAKKWAERN